MLVLHDPRALLHPAPIGYPERPERLSAILAGLADDPRFRVESAAGIVSGARVRAAIERVHDPAYVVRFERAAARGDGLLDSADNPIASATFGAAEGAVAATLAALEQVLGAERRAFAAVRPPGHHAERDTAMGFCFFANAAIAAQESIDRHAVERVAIVDVDVHHGNGTQHLFEERADVLYASLHQYPFYPGTGAAGERGSGAGAGATVNAPLPAGAGDAEWLDALDRIVLPALVRHRPQLVVVSAGFDAWRDDPLGGMRVSRAGFAALGRRLAEAAEEVADGRYLAVLEGGYDVPALAGLAAAFLSGAGEAEE